MDFSPQEKINIFKNLFCGREDVFAIYWEKADKSVSGYTPACLNEWKTGLCYKLQRQKCKDCPNEKLKQVESGNFQILIATGQLIGEGSDFSCLNCLFLVYPFSFESKLIQYIGRIQRGQNSNGTIYDYRDIKISYLEKFYKQR